jgi:hypothetical protein
VCTSPDQATVKTYLLKYHSFKTTKKFPSQVEYISKTSVLLQTCLFPTRNWLACTALGVAALFKPYHLCFLSMHHPHVTTAEIHAIPSLEMTGPDFAQTKQPLNRNTKAELALRTFSSQSIGNHIDFSFPLQSQWQHWLSVCLTHITDRLGVTDCSTNISWTKRTLAVLHTGCILCNRVNTGSIID